MLTFPLTQNVEGDEQLVYAQQRPMMILSHGSTTGQFWRKKADAEALHSRLYMIGHNHAG